MTAVGRFAGIKPVSVALAKSIHAPIPTPKKLSAFSSSIPGDAILNCGSDGDKPLSEIAPESTTDLKRTKAVPIMRGAKNTVMTFSVVLGLFAFFGCTVNPETEHHALTVSQVNADPSNFDGKQILIRGYVVLTPEAHILYESKDLNAKLPSVVTIYLLIMPGAQWIAPKAGASPPFNPWIQTFMTARGPTKVDFLAI